MLVKMETGASGGGGAEVKTLTTLASGGILSVDCGFQPKKLFIWSLGTGGTATLSNGAICIVYDSDLFGQNNFREYMRSNGADYASADTLPPTYWGNGLYEVNSTGFKIQTSASAGTAFNNCTWYYIAIP